MSEDVIPPSKQYKLPALTDEFLYQIIFCMEDQSNEYMLDLQSGQLVQIDFIKERMESDPERFLAIPLWRPVDGFKTMEKYVSTLRNPVFRERLRDVLRAGKGVFRQFKDTLHEQPALERLWYYFKDREIRNTIYLWYELHDEAFRLASLSDEEFAAGDMAFDLLSEDFNITSDNLKYEKEITEEFQQLLQLYQNSASVSIRHYGEVLKARWESNQERDFLIAETSGGDYAGFIAWRQAEPKFAEILAFVIKPEFRGMGLFRLLFDQLCRRLSRIGINELQIDLYEDALKLAQMFENVISEPVLRRYSIQTDAWNKHFESSDIPFLV